MSFLPLTIAPKATMRSRSRCPWMMKGCQTRQA